MQGDWWMDDSTNGRFVKESRNFHSQDRWFSSRPTSPPPSGSVTMPTVVTLTVQPLNSTAENSKIVRDGRPRPVPMGFGLGTPSSYTKRRKKLSKNTDAEKSPLSSQDPSKSQHRSASQPRPRPIQNDLDWTYFLDKHLPFSSANSPYSHQEIPTTASPLVNSSQLDTVRSINDDLQNLERKLERERDRRTNTETLGVAKFETKISRRKYPRPMAPTESPTQTASCCLSHPGDNDTTVLGDENMESYKRNNGFRPSARGTFFAREHHPSSNSSALTNSDNLLAMGALAITAPPSASSRKQQILTKDIRTQPSQIRSRGTMTIPLGRERTKHPKYVYADAVVGATPAFQQRISELASLENETLRYERTRKLKKKAKQERE